MGKKRLYRWLEKEGLESRKELIDKVDMDLSLVQYFIKKQNLAGYFDINKIAEDVFCKILNVAYGLNLIDLNEALHTNFPAIDLGDQKSRICYQITAQNKVAKIKQTICKFQELKLYEQYGKLNFLLLSPKREYRTIEYMKESYIMDIIDLDGLSQYISHRCDHEKMEIIIAILEREIINFNMASPERLADYLINKKPIPKMGDNFNNLLGDFDEENKKDHIKLIYEFAENLTEYSKDCRLVIYAICINRHIKHIELNCKDTICFNPHKICSKLERVIPSVANILKELIEEGRICESDYTGTYILNFFNRKYGVNILLDIIDMVSKEKRYEYILEDIIVNLDFTFLENKDDK